MQLDKIQLWLDATHHSEPPCSRTTNRADNKDDDDNNIHASKPNRKRRRSDTHITPPVSNQTRRTHRVLNMASPIRSDCSSLSKRPLDDETPRAKRIRASASSLISSDNAPSTFLQRSSAVSPTKQLRHLHLDPHGLDVRVLDYYSKDMPKALKTMCQRIIAFSKGKGIVPSGVQGELEKAAAEIDGFQWVLECMDYVDPAMVEGCTPSPKDVRDVVDDAVDRDTYGHPEANWNSDVHSPILRMAFQPKDKPKNSHLVDFMGCTTASVLPKYGFPKVIKRVDYCIYIDPKHDESAQTFSSAIARAQNVLPHGYASFTNFIPLYNRFIALSIETKKPGTLLETAGLQLGVWELARWAFLRRLVAAGTATTDVGTTGGRADEAREETEAMAGTVDQEEEVSVDTTTNLPLFLPGILIHGHDWWFVVTTVEGSKTVLWQKILIGSTSITMGVYQIVAALQYLGRWARDVHWPWLRAMVEAIPEEL